MVSSLLLVEVAVIEFGAGETSSAVRGLDLFALGFALLRLRLHNRQSLNLLGLFVACVFCFGCPIESLVAHHVCFTLEL